MIITTNQVKRQYLADMKSQVTGHFQFGFERFTGVFMGPFFHVTHHTEYEWDRQVHPKSAALGYVKSTDAGSEVRFILFRGAFRPFVFLSSLLIAEFVMLTSVPLSIWVRLLIGFGITLFAAGIETVTECLSERSLESRRALISFLLNPQDPYENLNKTS